MKDFRDMLGLLKKHGVEFLIVGAHAMAKHDVARATHDLDIWVRATSENAPRVFRALAQFGAPLEEFTVEEFATPGVGIHVGVPPLRIDVMTDISGIKFDEAWPRRLAGKMLGHRVFYISLADLIRNKKVAARDKDVLDVKRLKRQQQRLRKSARPKREKRKNN